MDENWMCDAFTQVLYSFSRANTKKSLPVLLHPYPKRACVRNFHHSASHSKTSPKKLTYDHDFTTHSLIQKCIDLFSWWIEDNNIAYILDILLGGEKRLDSYDNRAQSLLQVPTQHHLIILFTRSVSVTFPRFTHRRINWIPTRETKFIPRKVSNIWPKILTG